MNPEILVTGGSGILGSYVIRRLLDQGHKHITATYQADPATIPPDLRDRVNWLPLSLPDRQAALDVTAGMRWVVHTAGLVSYLRRDRRRLLEINRHGTADLIDAATAHGVDHFIYIGSIAALGKDLDQPHLDEKAGWIDNNLSTPYGLSKYLGELEAWRGEAEGLPVSVILPAIILGTGRADRSSMQLLHHVRRNPGWAPGGESGFVDVRDVAAFAGLLLQKEIKGERWLLSGGQLSYRDLFGRLGALMKLDNAFRVPPQWLTRLVYCRLKSLAGAGLSPELIRQAYSHIRYDASKSLTVEGFSYRPMETTLAEVASHLTGGQTLAFLPE